MCQEKVVKVEASSRVAPVRSGPSGRTSIIPSSRESSTHTPTPARQRSSRYNPKHLAVDPCLQTCDLWPHVSVGHAAYGWRSHPGDSELQHWGFCGSWHVSTLLWVKVASTTYRWTYVSSHFFLIRAALGHLRKVNVIVIHYSYLHKTFITVIS